MRKFWTAVHRWTGLSITAFLFVAGLTGSLLAFYSELDTWLNADLMTVVPRKVERLDLDILAERIEAGLPGYIVTGLTVSEQLDRAVTASVLPAGTEGSTLEAMTEAFIDPYDGRFLGARDASTAGLDARRLMPFLYSLHTSLHLPGVWGVWLMGGAALLWFFDNFVGAYLTFPMRPTNTRGGRRDHPKGWWIRWRPAWQIRTRASAYRLNFDVHRAFGLWFWAVLAMLALSSVYLNLPREVFNPVLGLFLRVTPFPTNFPKHFTEQRPMTFTQASTAARDGLPPSNSDLRLSFIGYDRETDVFRVGFGYPDAKTEWFDLRQENVFLEGRTGKVVGRFGSASATGAGDIFSNTLFPLHSGQLFGLPGRIVIALTGLTVTMLGMTGLVIWWRKRVARVSVRRKAMLARSAGTPVE
ncbi:PepSY-associated TM helix domain-containing protein [Methylobacterium sp. A54F]